VDEIRMANTNSIELEHWQPEGVTILEGEPRGRGFTLFEDFADGARATGIFECDPARTSYVLENNEIIYVLEGRATIALDNGSTVELSPGDFAYLPKGHLSIWTFHTRFKEFWALAD